MRQAKGSCVPQKIYLGSRCSSYMLFVAVLGKAKYLENLGPMGSYNLFFYGRRRRKKL